MAVFIANPELDQQYHFTNGTLLSAYFAGTPNDNLSQPFSSLATWFETPNSYFSSETGIVHHGEIFAYHLTDTSTGTQNNLPGSGDTAVIMGLGSGTGTITGSGTVGTLALDGTLVIAAGMITNSFFAGVDYEGSAYGTSMLPTSTSRNQSLPPNYAPQYATYVSESDVSSTTYMAGTISAAGSAGAVVTYYSPSSSFSDNPGNSGTTPSYAQTPTTIASNYILVSGSITSQTGTLSDSTIAVTGLLSFQGQEGVDIRYGSTIAVQSGGSLQSSVVTLEAGQQAAITVASGGTLSLTGGASGTNGPEGLLDSGTVDILGILQIPDAVVEVGVSSAGTLQISAGGQATTGFVEVGGQGTLLVSGGNAQMTSNASGTLVDNGQVSIDNTATLAVGNAILGEAAGDTGNALINGATMTVGNTLTVGEGGTGTLSIGNNATLQAGGNVEIGAQSGASGLLSLGSGATARVQGTLTAGASAGASGSVALDGGTTTLTVEGETAIGEAGAGTLALTNGASLLAIGKLEIGSGTAGGTGNATVAGAIVASSDLAVDNGSLSLAPSGTISVSGTLSAGEEAGGAGTITLASGAPVTDVAGIVIGGAGTGDLADAGATISAPGAEFSAGESAGGSGIATITGGLLEVSSLSVGSGGNGSLDLSGGTISVANEFSVGESSGGNGTATLDTGGVVTVGDGLTVGGQGTGELVVSDAQLDVASGDIAVGESSGSVGGLTVNIGTVTTGGNLEIGSSGNGAVDLQLGAGMTGLPKVSVGESAGGTGLLSLDGAILSTQTLTVGGGGKATLDLKAGAVLTTSTASIAEQPATSLDTATIDASTWQVAEDLTVGDGGRAQVTISGDSTLAVSGTLGLGGSAGAAGTITATGTGGTIDYASLVVGDGGAGTLLLQDGAIVTPGQDQPGTIAIAAQGGATGTIELSGSSSLTAAVLDIGGAGTSEGGTGVLMVGAGARVTATDVTVFGGGTIALAGGTLVTDPITIEAGGTVTGTGTLTGAITNDATIIAGAGTLDITDALAGTGSILLQAGATLRLDDGIAASETIDGLTSSQETVDLRSLAFVAGEMTTLVSGNTLTVGNGSETLALTMGDTSGLDFQLAADGAGGTDLTAACYAEGTHVLTPHGEVPVEWLAAGERVVALSGKLRTVRWIGRRDYDGRFIANNRLVLPVTILAGALGGGLPRRDLTVSPMHTLLLDGVLVPAVSLVNGTSIVQAAAVARVSYLHIELDTHDVLLAEGVAAESYRDDANLGQFTNAGTAPARTGGVASCAPVETGGAAVERWRRRGAGIGAPGAPGMLIGHVDTVSAAMISGWALDLANAAHGVTLEVSFRGRRIGTVIANWWRPDLARAGYGTGHHGFEFVPPASAQPAAIAFHRVADGAELAPRAWRRAG